MGTCVPSFVGEVAFVTGGAGGMGRAICAAFADLRMDAGIVAAEFGTAT